MDGRTDGRMGWVWVLVVVVVVVICADGCCLGRGGGKEAGMGCDGKRQTRIVIYSRIVAMMCEWLDRFGGFFCCSCSICVNMWMCVLLFSLCCYFVTRGKRDVV